MMGNLDLLGHTTPVPWTTDSCYVGFEFPTISRMVQNEKGRCFVVGPQQISVGSGIRISAWLPPALPLCLGRSYHQTRAECHLGPSDAARAHEELEEQCWPTKGNKVSR